MLDQDQKDFLYNVANNDMGLAEAYIKAGGNVNVCDEKTKNTALHEAVRNPLGSSILTVLLAAKADPNLSNSAGATPLMLAAVLGKQYLVKQLIDAGARVNFMDENGSTALMYAAEGGYQNIISMLLEEEAEPTLTDKKGDKAIDYADRKRHWQIVNLLKPYGDVKPSPPPPPPPVIEKPKPVPKTYPESIDGFKLCGKAAVQRASHMDGGNFRLHELFDFAARKIMTTSQTGNHLSTTIERFEKINDKTEIENAYDIHLKLGGGDVDWRTPYLPQKTKVDTGQPNGAIPKK